MALLHEVVGVLLAYKSLIVIPVLFTLLYFYARSKEVNVTEREPPILRPSIPYIGHFVSLLRGQTQFLKKLGETRGLPVATLPFLGGKVYVIWDPIVAQSAYCNKVLSITPIIRKNVAALTDFDDFCKEITEKTDCLPTYFKRIYDGTTAQHIHQLNVNSLKYVSRHINEIQPGGEGFVAPNTYMWLRNFMTIATCEALYGPNNPIADDDIVEDVWTFEDHLPALFLNLVNTAGLRSAKAARKRIQDALAKYHATMDEHDEEVSAYIRYRIGILRAHGVEGQRIGDTEVGLIHVPTSNSIPTIFWVFMDIFTRPELVAQLRAEVEPLVQRRKGPGGEDEATINVHEVTTRCPLLVSCYRESSRLCNGFTCNRIVLEDTTVTGAHGESWLLKKGGHVKMPAGYTHTMKSVWGPDADRFRADRFLDTGLSSEVAKARRAAWVAFGGGAHVCPGRNFATAEIYGFIASLLIGYNVGPVDGNWDSFKPPVMGDCPMATSVCKPENEATVLGTRITRRSGWEKTKWNFTSEWVGE